MYKNRVIIYRTSDGRASVALYAKDGKIWLNQQQMAELFATSKPNISVHIANILKENELCKDSVVKEFLTTAADGKNYNTMPGDCPLTLQFSIFNFQLSMVNNPLTYLV